MCKADNPEYVKPKYIYYNVEIYVEIILFQQVGYRSYCLRRVEERKSDEIRKNAMGEMKELARLFLKFKAMSETYLSFEDMLNRKYFPSLGEAIDSLSAKGEQEK